MAVGVDAVLGFESREGPAEDHGDVERCWICVRAMGELESVGCRVHLSEADGGRRESRRKGMREAMVWVETKAP